MLNVPRPSSCYSTTGVAECCNSSGVVVGNRATTLRVLRVWPGADGRGLVCVSAPQLRLLSTAMLLSYFTIMVAVSRLDNNRETENEAGGECPSAQCAVCCSCAGNQAVAHPAGTLLGLSQLGWYEAPPEGAVVGGRVYSPRNVVPQVGTHPPSRSCA